MRFLINFHSDTWWTLAYNTFQAPYAYHHIQNFTSNMTSFKQKLESTDFHGNSDLKEAGLDALMQACACSGNYLYVNKYLYNTNMFA